MFRTIRSEHHIPFARKSALASRRSARVVSADRRSRSRGNRMKRQPASRQSQGISFGFRSLSGESVWARPAAGGVSTCRPVPRRRLESLRATAPRFIPAQSRTPIAPQSGVTSTVAAPQPERFHVADGRSVGRFFGHDRFMPALRAYPPPPSHWFRRVYWAGVGHTPILGAISVSKRMILLARHSGQNCEHICD